MLKIEPIKLKAGTHEDTATTGSGCFMNVIAYLNGEAQITDQSPCVCVTIRKTAIWLNDYMTDNERHLLIPFIHRAMGTATEDRMVMESRLLRVVKFAKDCADAARYATRYAARYAASAQYAAASAQHAASAQYAAASAQHAASAQYAAASAQAVASAGWAAAAAASAAAASAADPKTASKQLVYLGLQFMDDICPPADTPTQDLIERANKLVELHETMS